MATQPLYGDPKSKAPVWSKYAVLIGSATATTPAGNAAFTLNDPDAGTPVTTQWDPLGALDSDNPFDNGAESIDSTDHSAAGHGVYATTYKNQKETVTVTVKETTLVTLDLLYDASGVTDDGDGNLTGVLKRRDPTETFKIGFHRENATQCERRVGKTLAYIDSISRTFGNDESMYAVTFVIPPTAADELWDYYLGEKA